MDQIKQDLCRLCNAAGCAGLTHVTSAAVALLTPMTDSVEVDAMGNVIAYINADKPDAPTVMLEAHMDEIGFLVTHIDDQGFIYVAPAGGIDRRTLTSQEVVIYTEQRVVDGIFCSVPPHLAGKDGELLETEKRAIDVGMTAKEAKAIIPLGSRVTFKPRFIELNDHLVTSKALDDRAGMAAILHCLRHLKRPLSYRIAVAFCVQEELGCRGASPAVYSIRPDRAILTDVSFALTPDADPNQCGKLGKGVMIGISPILDKSMTDELFSLAEKTSIPFQYEVMGGSTGTDADRISNSLTGIPSALLSIPQRYMHTPIEMVDVRDVAAVGNLMAAYIMNGGAES